MPNFKHQPIRSQLHSGTAAERNYDLAALLPLWPHELSDPSPAGREKRLLLLRRALRAERQRGLAGHWAYDLGRHAALLRFYRREMLAQTAVSTSLRA